MAVVLHKYSTLLVLISVLSVMPEIALPWLCVKIRLSPLESIFTSNIIKRDGRGCPVLLCHLELLLLMQESILKVNQMDTAAIA